MGETELAQTIRRIKEKEIDVLTSGTQPPNPSELLSSDEMKIILDELVKVYDYIFLDTTPIMLVSDALILSNLATGVIVVIRENKTNHKLIKETLDRIKMVNTKVLGMVLTNDRTRLGKKAYYGTNYENYSV